MTPGAALLLAACGAVGGAVNAVAGGGSLLTFPALLAVGFTPLAANVTNTVGLLPGYLGGTWGYRTELAGQRQRLRALVPYAAAGAVAGTVLLLTFPARVFADVVPYLVLTACALLFVSPRLAALLRRRPAGAARASAWWLRPAVLLSGLYASYFGAAVSVILLAVLGLLIEDTLQRLNALKSALSFAATAVGAAVFVAVAPVAPGAALLLAASSLVGGRFGAGLARRLPDRVLRGVVLAVGVAVAVRLIAG